MEIKKVLMSLGFAGLGIFIQSCSESETGKYSPTTYNVNGKVEKGPFISGSTINLQPMDANMQALGSTFSATISDNTGNFTFGAKTLDAPYAQLTANGYFFNEVEGDLSKGTLTLRAIVNLADQSTVNVNILTHLKYQRILNLIQQDKSFKEANSQAQKELLTAFGLQRLVDTDVSQYSIAVGTDEAGALIAISSLLLKGRTDAQLTEYLAKLSEEFGHSGSFSATTQAQFKKDRIDLNDKLSRIRSNILSRYQSLGMEVSVKDLSYFFDWNDDGIAGNEIAGSDNPVTLEKTELNVPKEGGEYVIKINASVPVTLNPPTTGEIPPLTTTPDMFFDNLYESQYNPAMSIEKSVEANTLKITVKESKAKQKTNANIDLYDYRGSKVATLHIIQDGNPNLPIPKLGTSGKSAITGFAFHLSHAAALSHAMDARYTGIITDNSFMAPVSPSNDNLNKCWEYFYKAINMNLLVLDADAKIQNVYQDFLKTFNALCYYNLTVYWAGVPYLTTKTNADASPYIPRSSEEEIFQSLTSNLEKAIDNLEEKKNKFAVNDINDLLFVSKDVARTILAHICMYRGNYSKAKALLTRIESNNYYQLESSLNYTQSSKELILGLYEGDGTRNTSTSITPLLTYTDVLLSLAECEKHAGNASAAEKYLKMVATAKGITVPSDVISGIKEIRKKATQGGYFAFLKRNGLAESELKLRAYQLLLPIPYREVSLNPMMKQNPGY